MPVKFDRQHYNALAKLFRENFPQEIKPEDMVNPLENLNKRIKREQHVLMIVELAEYFVKGDPGFKPLKFLDACSPDTDVYPLSELWDGEET